VHTNDALFLHLGQVSIDMFDTHHRARIFKMSKKVIQHIILV
jgi:hypothetical protein